MRTPTHVVSGASAEDPSVLPAPLRRALVGVVATGAVLSVMLTPVFGIHFAFSLAVGAAIAASNLWVIARAVRAYFGGQGGVGWGLFAVLKFSALVVGLYLLFRSGFVQGLPLAVGLGSLPIGIVLAELAAPLAVKEGRSAQS
jgi:hypothetical protein